MKDGILVVNKEAGPTSRDVVNKISKHLNIKKIGHTGTLDPLASGVLVMCIGKATKLVDMLISIDKEYIATMELGFETDTLDKTGKLLRETKVRVTENQVKRVLESCKGISNQEVPLYSAVKVRGKKLYEYARNNEFVIPPKKQINVFDIELLEFVDNKVTFRVLVSKGTYIRSLIRDIGYRLGTFATMTDLIRTKQGRFDINEAFYLEDILNNNYNIIPIEEILKYHNSLVVDDTLFNKIRVGQIIDKDFNDKYCVFLNKNNKVIAIYQEYERDKTKAKPYKMFI